MELKNKIRKEQLILISNIANMVNEKIRFLANVKAIRMAKKFLLRNIRISSIPLFNPQS